jgi:hypothetical protein
MKSLLSSFRGLGLTVLMLACLTGAALAGPVSNVTVSKGPDWVKVNITGSFNYSVKHLPQGGADYRSVAVDLSPAYIAGGLEPKAVLPVNFGLVGQVRVRQLGGGVVRVYIDVINYPEYSVTRTGNGVQIGLRAFKQRAYNPAAQY